LQARNQSRETFGRRIEFTHLLAAGRTKEILEVSYDEQVPRILCICRFDRRILCPRARTFLRCSERKVFRYPGWQLYTLFANGTRMQMADRSNDRRTYGLLGGSVGTRLQLRS